MLSSAFQGLGNVCPKFGIFTLPIMQFVFPDCLGEVPEAIAYKCFKLNWFDFHWVKKDENAISLGSGCLRSNLDERHIGGRGGGGTSQLLFLASHRHCLGIGSQLDNAANLFILLFIMKLYHVHLAPDFLPCLHSIRSLLVTTSVSWWSMKCLRVNWLITEKSVIFQVETTVEKSGYRIPWEDNDD